jgi:RNA polymerase sigma-70 factor (ECF subfamily)
MSELTHTELSTLVREHGQDLHQFLARRLGCADTAKDLLQDTFLRLLQAAPRHVLSNPRAFLFRIATNLVIDHHRRRRHREALAVCETDVTIDQADPGPSIETVVWSKQQVSLLKQAVADLPPKCRQVFLLIKFHHLSHAEVAMRLGISQSTVVKHMIKAVDYCKRRVREHEPQTHRPDGCSARLTRLGKEEGCPAGEMTDDRPRRYHDGRNERP